MQTQIAERAEQAAATNQRIEADHAWSLGLVPLGTSEDTLDGDGGPGFGRCVFARGPEAADPRKLRRHGFHFSTWRLAGFRGTLRGWVRA